MDIQKLLSGIDCSCGKKHTCDIKHVFVGNDAICNLPRICENYNNILLVADENTYAAAGEKVMQNIGTKITAKQIFTGDTVLIPNEEAIAAVGEKLPGCDLIVGVGSGVIQDLCKYVSFFNNVPYYIVATAPSMDGYASSGAAMITDGMKVTYSAKVPDAIIADTSVLRDAPMDMIKSGYGDIIGKFSALNDWKLSHVVNGEYFCQYIYDLTMEMLNATLPLAKKLLDRDEESVKILTEALIIVGIAMSFAGNSRPASGSEHHLSHYFEITGIIDNEEYLPHGTDVAFSTVVTAKIREFLTSSSFPTEGFVMPSDTYESEMKRVYKTVADGCIALQEKVGNYSSSRISAYLNNEKEIKAILSECPTAEKIEQILSDIGLDMALFHDTYSDKKISDAIKYAKDLKDRYTVLWMYYDLFGVKEI